MKFGKGIAFSKAQNLLKVL